MNPEDKDVAKPPVSVEIAARAEARFEVKADVPPASVGRLVDALTDIIRPFSERRGLKADLLRLQREEVAIEIAKRARAKIAIEGQIPEPVSTKLLVSLFEKGSCEDAQDEIMIDRWADLLASASLRENVQPRFVGILGELSGKQAVCLEYIAFHKMDEYAAPHRMLVDAPHDLSIRNVSDSELVDFFSQNLTKKGDISRAFELFARSIDRPGGILEDLGAAGKGFDLSRFPTREGWDDEDLDILENLGLLRRVDQLLYYELKKPRGGRAAISISYYHVTEIGVAFCSVCCRNKMQQIKKVDEENSAKGKTQTDAEWLWHWGRHFKN